MKKSPKKQSVIDCLIIGAGPAGLAAAIYLARFRRTFKLFDSNESRALLIPLSHNYPGFANGVSGPDLLVLLKSQLKPYHIEIINEKIEKLTIDDNEHFVASSIHSTVVASTVLLATGVEDIEPKLPNVENAIHRGLVRHCPICDAYEVIDKKIAVISSGKSGLGEALFLRHYSPHVTLLTQGKVTDFSKDEIQQLKDANIKLVENPILKIDMNENSIGALHFEQDVFYEFDTIYSALGCVKKNNLAINLGAKHKERELIVDEHQQTSIPGLYAAGDIVSGLNQICVAQSQAAIAATDIHNRCKASY